MKIKYIGKNTTFTPAMQGYTAKKLQRLEKYFVIENDTEVRVVARTYPHSQKVEITIPTKFGTLRTEKTATGYYGAVDIAMDTLEKQIRKLKTKLVKRNKSGLTAGFLDETANEPELPVVKEKHIPLVTMSVDEAITEMLLTSHDFYLFIDEDTQLPAVVYARKHGDYGLLTGIQE